MSKLAYWMYSILGSSKKRFLFFVGVLCFVDVVYISNEILCGDSLNVFADWSKYSVLGLIVAFCGVLYLLAMIKLLRKMWSGYSKKFRFYGLLVIVLTTVLLAYPIWGIKETILLNNTETLVVNGEVISVDKSIGSTKVVITTPKGVKALKGVSTDRNLHVGDKVSRVTEKTKVVKRTDIFGRSKELTFFKSIIK